MSQYDPGCRRLSCIGFSLFVIITFSSAAHSGTDGYNLSWTDCGSFGEADRIFTCDADTGNHVLSVSFAVANETDGFQGAGVWLRLSAVDGTMPDWWRFDACRSNALTVGMSTGSCSDPLEGAGAPIGPINVQFIGPDRLRIGFGNFQTDGQTRTLQAGVEYLVGNLLIDNQMTTAPSGCTGCSEGVDITVDFVLVFRSAAHGGNFTINDSLNRSQVTWQGGSVPVYNRSWGQIKGMYR